jgi:hypothetical protein
MKPKLSNALPYCLAIAHALLVIAVFVLIQVSHDPATLALLHHCVFSGLSRLYWNQISIRNTLCKREYGRLAHLWHLSPSRLGMVVPAWMGNLKAGIEGASPMMSQLSGDIAHDHASNTVLAVSPAIRNVIPKASKCGLLIFETGSKH